MVDSLLVLENIDTRARILAAAEGLAQRRSTATFTLNELAEVLGLHYTAVYHYFQNADHLRCELIELHSRRQSEELAKVQGTGKTAFEKLTEFVQLILHNPPTALLVRHASNLDKPYQDRVKRALAKNRKELASLVQAGIDDGSIRPCKPLVVGAIVSRILGRYVNQREKVFSNAQLDADILTKQVIGFITYGLRPNEAIAGTISESPRATFRALQTNDSQLDLILTTLTRSFNDLGFRGTSIPEVARSIGLSKTSFYRFATSKTELLYLCAHRSLNLMAQVRHLSTAITENPLDALLHNLYFDRYLINNEPGPTLKTDLFDSLSEEYQRVVWDLFTGHRRELILLLQQCVEQGLSRSVNAFAVQPILAAATLSVDAENPEKSFSDDAVDFILCGIKQR